MDVVAAAQAELVRLYRVEVRKELRRLRYREKKFAALRVTDGMRTAFSRAVEEQRRRLTIPPKLKADDLSALKDYEGWQRLSRDAGRFKYFQRMSAIEVGYHLGLLPSELVYPLSLEAIHEQGEREQRREKRRSTKAVA